MAEKAIEGLLCPNGACPGIIRLAHAGNVYKCDNRGCNVEIKSEQDWILLYGYFTEVNFASAKRAFSQRIKKRLKDAEA